MKKFLMQICWMMLILWGAMKAGFALQVIEPAQVFIVGDEAACNLAGAPLVGGGCKAYGRLEGTVGGTWRLYTASSPTTGVELPRSVGLMYHGDAYSFRGGQFAGYALAVITFILAGLPILTYLLNRRSVKV